jgi:hypothetical protein
MKVPSLVIACGLATISACTWVKLEKPGAQVRVVSASQSLASCTFKGDITTTVTNRVVGVERNSIKVADELETLARNEAAGLGANTLQPQSEAVAGEQRFRAYLCP